MPSILPIHVCTSHLYFSINLKTKLFLPFVNHLLFFSCWIKKKKQTVTLDKRKTIKKYLVCMVYKTSEIKLCKILASLYRENTVLYFHIHMYLFLYTHTFYTHTHLTYTYMPITNIKAKYFLCIYEC